MRALARSILTLGAAAAFVALPAPDVRAQAPATTSAELLVLHGTQTEKGGIDPRIGDLPELGKPPLSAYNTYALLDRQTLALTQGQGTRYAMPNGATLTVTLTDVTDGRYTLKEEVSGGGLSKPLKVEFTSSAGDTVFVGGFPYKGGAMFLGITIKP